MFILEGVKGKGFSNSRETPKSGHKESNVRASCAFSFFPAAYLAFIHLTLLHHNRRFRRQPEMIQSQRHWSWLCSCKISS